MKLINTTMINAQCLPAGQAGSMLNECGNAQWINALHHCFIDYSLTLDHCPLTIASKGGVL